jgi:hypothetical protein
MKGAAIAVLALVGFTGTAMAQTPDDLRRLDRWSAERSAAHPVPQMAPPVSAPAPRITPLSRHWVCMSADEMEPVYSSPTAQSRRIGATTEFVVSTGAVVDGYVEVLHYNGQLGFVRQGVLRPWSGTRYNPRATCRVLGVKDDETPAFSIR